MAGMMNPRAAAAESMMGAMPPVPEGEDMAAVEPEGPPDIETALAGVEAAIGGLDPAIAEQAREHLNAIRDLVTGDATALAESAPMPEGMPPEEPKINA